MNLIKNTSKNHLYIKNTVKSKYQLLINGKEKVGIKNKKFKTIHYYSQTIDDVYKNLEDNKEIQQKKRKVLIVVDDMIADVEANKKLSPIVTELFLIEKKFNISLVFISQSYFKVPKTIRLNATHLIMKILNKRELQQITSNDLSDIDFKNFMKLFKDYTKEPYSFSVNDTTM